MQRRSCSSRADAREPRWLLASVALAGRSLVMCTALLLAACRDPGAQHAALVTAPPPPAPPLPAAPLPLAIGDTALYVAFGAARAGSAWEATGNAIVEEVGADGDSALRFRCPTSERCSGYATRAFPARTVANAHLVIEAEIRGSGISEPLEPWNGVKVALIMGSGSTERWRQATAPTGDFDWQTIRAVMEVPADVDTIRALLGLELGQGKLDVRRVTVRVIGRQRTEGPASGAWSAPFAGLHTQRLRGAMTDERNRPADLALLGTDWKANAIRWQLRPGMVREAIDPVVLADYPRAIAQAAARLDAALPALRAAGLWVLVELHVPPGGHERTANGGFALFQEPEHQRAFVEAWGWLAERYRGVPNIWGFELLNEPIEGITGPRAMHWRALAIAATRRIREADSTRIVVVQPALGGAPAGLDFLEPLPFPGVAYSVHLYEPGGFTHQGLDGRPSGVSYPGLVDGTWWDASALARTLAPVDRYVRDYGVRVLVTEFGTVRGTPGESGTAWYRDMIAHFEARGLDWIFHAWRESPVFSVETDSGPNVRAPTAPMTGREAAIREAFAGNVRPAW